MIARGFSCRTFPRHRLPRPPLPRSWPMPPEREWRERSDNRMPALETRPSDLRRRCRRWISTTRAWPTCVAVTVKLPTDPSSMRIAAARSWTGFVRSNWKISSENCPREIPPRHGRRRPRRGPARHRLAMMRSPWLSRSRTCCLIRSAAEHSMPSSKLAS